FAGLGVIVIQAERASLGRLQKVDDVPILMGAFGQSGTFGRALRWRRLPAPRVRERMRLRGITGLRAGPGFHLQRRLPRRLMHEADLYATVRQRERLRWNVALGQLIARRQDDRVPANAKSARKNDRVAVSVVAARILVHL